MSFDGWKELCWGDVASLEYGKSLKSYKGSKGNIPVYGTNGPIGFTNTHLCPFPSVIIGRKGAYRGIHFSKVPFFVIDTAFYLKPKIEELDISYAYYQLLTQNINEMDSGSAIPSTSREDFYNLKLRLPPLNIQRRIASILSSIDDKIEFNRQINQTLEAIAQAVFKEWFVDFNFPGATGEKQASKLGEVPKGWKIGALSDILNIEMGQSPAGSSYNQRNEGIIFFQGKAEFGFRFPVIDKYTREPKRFANKFDTLLSVRAPVGNINMATERCCIGRGLAALRGKNNESSFTYYLLNSIQSHFSSYDGAGTVFGSINKSQLENMQIIIPPIGIIKKFEQKICVMDEFIFNNEQQIQTLTQLRDTLLPKLMKGEISIPEI